MSSSVPEPWLLVRRAGRPMATDVSVQIAVAAEQEEAASHAADACMAWFDEVDARLSRFRPESELSQLNRSAGRWFTASSVLFEAVEMALWAARASGGRFDPTLLRHLEALGYDRDFAQIAQRNVTPAAPLVAAPEPETWRAVELDPRRRRIRLPASVGLDPRRRRIRLPASVGLDLGGIAKGWAADVALERFFGDFPNALVDVGGDMRVRGEVEEGHPWPIGVGAGRAIRDNQPDAAPEQQAVVTLGKGGLATSGAGARWWLRAGERAHHLIDPRTGRPARIWLDVADDRPDEPPLIASASAFAPTAAEAEVAAKVALLLGYPAALEAAEAVEEAAKGALDYADRLGVALLLTLGTGAVVFSSNLPAYLARMGGGDIWIS
jgi:FAD:protein FMN transferase